MNNYHTHTYRCKHAVGDVMDYARVAEEKGVAVLGISDHTPLPDQRWGVERMDMSELDSYIQAIEKGKEKYPHIKLLKGMECEYTKEYYSFYKDELKGRLGFDYLIGAAHYFPYQGSWVKTHCVAKEINHVKALKAYGEYIVKSMEVGLFDFMAHPDLFGHFYEEWDENTVACARYILEAAQDLKMPLEINGYGLRKPKIQTSQGIRCMYPWEPFWEIASEYNITVTINSDAHHPQDIVANMDEAMEIAKKYDLSLADFSYLDNK